MHTSLTLNQIPKNQKAIITAIDDREHPSAEANSIEKRLLEMGFVEGAPVMLLHEAPFSRDPLIVRLRNNRVAIRRSEAKCIQVELE